MMIPVDKKLHFLGGGCIAALSWGTAFLLTSDVTVGLAWGAGAAVVAGVGKELYDATGKGTPDVWDAVATSAGAFVLTPLAIMALL